MLSDKILDFYSELREEVSEQYNSKGFPSSSTAFKSVFLSYIVETNNAILADCIFIDFKKDSNKIKLDGYCFSEYFNSLTLLVSIYEPKQEPRKIGKVEIDKTLKKALRFYNYCDTDFFQDLEESSEGYEAYESIKNYKKDIETVNIVLITNNEATNFIPEDSKIGKVTVKYDVWDIERLYNAAITGESRTRELVIRLKSKYKAPLTMIKVPYDNNDVYDCYVGVMSGAVLAKIYKDEGQELIQKNVRSFLQATGKVNRGIKSSLAREPQMFMAYNNGISTVADSISEDTNSKESVVVINEIRGWQIVNGGQTTASIYNAFQSKLPLDDVYVQIKLTVIKRHEHDQDIIHNISQYANSQNKINMSDFNANDPYHVEMEQISRTTFIPVARGKSTDQWFYERARGQYLVELSRQATPALKRQFKDRCPKKRCISKTVAAKCLMAWLGYPNIVSKGLETNFIFFSEKIQSGEIPLPSIQSYTEMIAKVILFNTCDDIIKEKKFGGFKAQQDYYTVALLGRYYSKWVNFQQIWEKQKLPANLIMLISELADFVWEHFQAPTVHGVNTGQWCKKEDCWILLRERFEQSELYSERGLNV